MVVDHREPRLRFQVCAQGEAFAGHPALWLSLVRWRAHKGSSAAWLPCDGQAQSKRRVHRHRRRHGSRKGLWRPRGMGSDRPFFLVFLLPRRPARMDFFHRRAHLPRALYAGQRPQPAGVLLLGSRDGRPCHLGSSAFPQVKARSTCSFLLACATCKWKLGRPSALPVIFKAAVEMTAAQSENLVCSPYSPEHTRSFEAEADYSLEALFDHTRANKQMLAPKLGISHALRIPRKVVRFRAYLLGNVGIVSIHGT